MEGGRGSEGVGGGPAGCIGARLRAAAPDLGLLALLLCFNPLLFGPRLPLNLPPDAVAYLTLAESILNDGLLYLRGWGHVDTSLQLSPLYPLLIALVDLLRADMAASALLVSALSMMLVTLLLYVLVRRFAAPAVAAAALTLVGSHAFAVVFANSVFTEALFLVPTVAAVLFAVVLGGRDRVRLRDGWLLGTLAGLGFLTRQMGLVLCLVLLVWTLADLLVRRTANGFWQPRLVAGYVLGCAALCGTYAMIVQQQTGHSVFTQSYREYRYAAYSDDAALLRRIERLESVDSDDYLAIYENRRALRELLPDGREMLDYVLPGQAGTTDVAEEPVAEPRDAVREAWRFLRNLVRNGSHFASGFGVPLLVLAILACLTPLLLAAPGVPLLSRLVLPVFIAAYLAALSLLTGAVARYTEVLFPFAVVQLAIETSVLIGRVRHGAARLVAVGVVAGVFVLLLLVTPRSAFDLNFARNWGTSGIRHRLLDGAPAISLLPVHAWQAGGTYRVAPNDTIERVVHYARATGVRWLVLPRLAEGNLDVRLYDRSDWLREPGQLKQRPELLRYHGVLGSDTGESLLFEVLPAG